MSLNNRLIYLVVSFLPVGIIYILTGCITGNKWIVPSSIVEDIVPFSASGIWLYLFFYIYIPYTFIVAHESKIKILTISFLVSSIISGIIFSLFPSTIIYTDFEVNDISSYCLNFVVENDTAQNCFPSLHAVLITLCTLVNFDKSQKIKTFVIIILTFLMYYSIIQVRRHVFIDLSAGIIIALITWSVSLKLKDF